MNFETQFTDDVTLNFSGLESFDPTENIYLLDFISNKTVNLSNRLIYTFNHNPENAATLFHLVFVGTTGIVETTNPSAEIWFVGNTLNIHAPHLGCQSAMLEVFKA